MNNTLSAAYLERLVAAALREDVGTGDATTIACIPAHVRGSGAFICKHDGVLCGLNVAAKVFSSVDSKTKLKPLFKDGTRLRKGTIFATVTGTLRSLLIAERTALNFLQRMSGVATKTHAFVKAAKGTNAVILDTRKTTPLLRPLEKYAVRIGGGENHRSRLDEMMLIKDNHIAAAGSIQAAVQRCVAKRGKRRMLIEVETTSIAQVREILAIQGIDRIMLDNYSLAEIRAAVKLVNHRIPLEVSGGVNLKTVGSIAKTGVEYISVGAITHSAPAVDISFEIA